MPQAIIASRSLKGKPSFIRSYSGWEIFPASKSRAASKRACAKLTRTHLRSRCFHGGVFRRRLRGVTFSPQIRGERVYELLLLKLSETCHELGGCISDFFDAFHCQVPIAVGLDPFEMEWPPQFHDSRNFVELSKNALVPVAFPGDPFRLQTTANDLKICFTLNLTDFIELLLTRLQFLDCLVHHLLGNAMLDQRPSILDVDAFFDDGLPQ